MYSTFSESQWCRQKGCIEQDDLLRPFSSLDYAWDEPTLPHHLVLELPGNRRLGIYDLDRVGGQSTVHLAATAQRAEQRIQVCVHADGPKRVLQLIDLLVRHRTDIAAAAAAAAAGRYLRLLLISSSQNTQAPAWLMLQFVMKLESVVVSGRHCMAGQGLMLLQRLQMSALSSASLLIPKLTVEFCAIPFSCFGAQPLRVRLQLRVLWSTVSANQDCS